MKLTSDQIEHVAKLANLSLSPQKIEKYSEQLSEILDYIDLLNKADTQNIEPTFNVTGLSNITQQDISRPSLTQEEALANASNQKDGFFVTKGVFEEE